MMTRRALLRSTALVAPAVLAGCAGIAAAVALAPEIASGISALGSVASIVLPIIGNLTGLSGSVSGVIATAIADVEAVGNDIASATGSTATSLVQKLGSATGTLAGLFSGVAGLPDIVSRFVTDAVSLANEAEVAVGLKSAAAPPAAYRFGRFAAMASPDAARLDLAAILAGH